MVSVKSYRFNTTTDIAVVVFMVVVGAVIITLVVLVLNIVVAVDVIAVVVLSIVVAVYNITFRCSSASPKGYN